MEGDGSALPAMLGEAMRSLANALIAMSKEEAAELLAGAGAIPDAVAEANTAAAPLSFIKAFAAVRAKAGRASQRRQRRARRRNQQGARRHGRRLDQGAEPPRQAQ